MTEDEQEARSAKYVMARVMRLASGRFALFLGDDLSIHDGVGLLAALPAWDALPEATPKAKTERIRALNLADLGL